MRPRRKITSFGVLGKFGAEVLDLSPAAVNLTLKFGVKFEYRKRARQI